MEKEIFAKSVNGINIYIDRVNSHALTHFTHSPQLADEVREVIAKLNIKEELRIEHDTGKMIGLTDLYETNEGDEIVYAKRVLRDTYSRFVKNKEPQQTSWLTLHIKKQDDEYFLYTAFIGRSTPSFPGGDYLPEQSKSFWSTHALVWGTQEVVPATETSVSPWD